MAKLRAQLRSLSRRKTTLSSAEFTSLKDLANRPTQRTIPDEHRDRLTAAGYIREVVRHSGTVNAFALTGAGIRRLEFGRISSLSVARWRFITREPIARTPLHLARHHSVTAPKS